MGVPIARRVGLFEEGITLMRRLWTEPEVTFQGRYFQVQSVRLGLRPLQQSGVPLWLAGSADNAFRRVLRLGNGWSPISSSPQAFTADWERLEVLGQEMGRNAHDLHRCLYTTLNVNADVAQAERELRAFIESYYGIPYEVQATRNGLCAGSAETLHRVAQGVHCCWGTNYRGPLRQSRSDGTTSAVCPRGFATFAGSVKPLGRQKSMLYQAAKGESAICEFQSKLQHPRRSLCCLFLTNGSFDKE